MAHITSIGASMFSDLSISQTLTNLTAAAAGLLDTSAEFFPLFQTEIALPADTKTAGTFARIKNVREFPSIGTPPNIVNVPVYGQKTSQQIQGQADAPNMEITVNFVADDWSSTSLLGPCVGNGQVYAFRFTLMNTEPTGAGATKYASAAPGLGAAVGGNSQYFWVGKIDSLLVNPQLTDATTATIAITLNSAVYGAYTI